jgi:hypothetical protein
MAEEPTYDIDEISKLEDIVFMDTCALDKPHHSVLACVYDCKNKLDLDKGYVEEEIVHIASRIVDVDNCSNIFVVPEVADEIGEYLDKLNWQIKYQSKHVNPRSIGRKPKYNGRADSHRSSDSKRYKKIDKNEKLCFESLNILADKLYELKRNLKNRVIKLDNEKMLDRLKQVSDVEIIEKYGEKFERYPRKDGLKRYTDEKIIAAAYELAMKGKKVSIVTSDIDYENLLNYCFRENKMFKVPERGTLSLYADYEDDLKFKKYFDSVFLLM